MSNSFRCVVESQQRLDVIAVVAQPRDFVLPAEFAALFHPFVEEPGSCLYQFEFLQRDVLEAFGFVVAVDFLQF